MTISSGEKKGQPDQDGRVEALLDCADDGIGDKLKAFGKEQTAGELLNESLRSTLRSTRATSTRRGHQRLRATRCCASS